MARIIAIDYGLKRCGLAWTDPMQIIASGLETVPEKELLAKLKSLAEQEEVEGFVLGLPSNMDGSDTHSSAPVREFRKKLQNLFPNKDVYDWDERLTSKMAVRALIEAGVPKMKRRNKGLVDQMSATLILQEFLESRI